MSSMYSSQLVESTTLEPESIKESTCSAFQRLYRSFHCLIAHVVAELGDIHAERTVLDGGDSGGIAVKASHDGIGIHLLSINAEKLHFS